MCQQDGLRSGAPLRGIERPAAHSGHSRVLDMRDDSILLCACLTLIFFWGVLSAPGARRSTLGENAYASEVGRGGAAREVQSSRGARRQSAVLVWAELTRARSGKTEKRARGG